ncbi:MAG: leucine-rich repeat domain-containing protein [Lachnoclostridium sp.]|nr:leucine-rich repeat domain-containing protein [Lachnospira sp.]MCM1248561.1 leucine-rich repeat domain-containing protein [Lachnoclostridium sp.]MCM1535788.1 leucine-rich repeat domain-containing protein [Clostridium sp.]
MKAKSKLFGVLLVIAALIIMQLPKSEADAATSASDFKMEGTTLVKYTGRDKTVTVPDTVEVIGKGAFEDNSIIEKVNLPSSVKQIKPYAFWGCDRLETVSLGSGLTEVGDFAFINCKGLKRMIIPTTIRTIGIQAFADCVNLTDISIPPEVTEIHETAFDGCYRLVIHSEAGSYADKYAQEFYERQQEMPEYEDVPDYQPTPAPEPDDSYDNTVTLPEEQGNILGSTSVVADQAVFFVDSSSLKVMDRYNNLDGGSDVLPPEWDPDENNEVFPKYTIVDGTTVADQAYYRSSFDGGEVQIPEGIKEIGQFSYARSNLKKIAVPEGMETISYGAFYHCDFLTDVSLPQTITSVEPKAFTHTAWVENFLAKEPSGTDDDFLISGGTLIAYKGNSDLVKVPKDVKVIAAEVFKDHAEIKAVVLYDNVRVIGEGAFENCSSLKALEVPVFVTEGKGITDIKDRAFKGCTIGQVTLPATLANMGLQAFDDSVKLIYTKGTPATSHELSAERLSNESYRPVLEDGAVPGVTVKGMESVTAQLEGAARQYTLTVTMLSGNGNDSARGTMAQAFGRAGEAGLPAKISLYEISLTDNSGIPISKLGKQRLIVTMPVPDGLSGEGVRVVTLDRNGQLEQVSSERVRMDGRDYIRFYTSHLSLYGIYGDGAVLEENSIQEVTTLITSMAAAPGSSGTAPEVSSAAKAIPYRFAWILSGILLVTGTVCIFRKVH